MRIAIIGFGRVGRAFVQLLVDKKTYLEREGIDARIIYVIDLGGGIYQRTGISRDDLMEIAKRKDLPCSYPHGGSKDVTFVRLLEKRDVDVVIEMTPTNKDTGEPGMTHIKESLAHGMHVVTSNKGPILLAYKQLNELARRNSIQLGIGCTCGGALPTINGGIIDMAGSNIVSIEGVLNGTTNFIIDEMENNKVSYEEALAKAQELGIAETDPKLDVEGWDTASKLLILTNVLMNEEKTLGDISVSGITGLTQDDINRAKRENKRYRLIGKTLEIDNELRMSVKLERLSSSHPFYTLEGANKAVRYISDTLGDLTMVGGASDLRSAAASILRDCINIQRGYTFSK
ncbi:MAG: homoserine dehydrogenase [Candidatus Hodarchaeota archaeon]